MGIQFYEKKMTRKDAKEMLCFFPGYMLLICTAFWIHHLKPSWYWDGWTNKLFRWLLGDTIVDILGYIGYSALGMGLIGMWIKAGVMLSSESAEENESDNQSGAEDS